MDDLESQIAKIQLSSSKTANSFVYILAEKAAGSNAELYVVAELPLLNPAAEESCQQICASIASALKRVYKRAADDSSFENAIAQINEELGKLASMGQTQWVNKLNCILAAKNKNSFAIATCGKVAAYLLRNRELTDISCSSSQSHPLKTFENVAVGKIRLGDLLVLSTPQLFNYLALDRVKTILTNSELLPATQTIIELLKENAGPEVAFGTILNLQVQPGQTANQDIDLEEYVVEKPSGSALPVKILNFFKSTFALGNAKRAPQVTLPQISLSQRVKNITWSAKNFFLKTKAVLQSFTTGVAESKKKLDIQNYKNFSFQKKFFFISALTLLVAFIFFVLVANRYKSIREGEKKIADQLQQTNSLLSNAQTSLLYNNQDQALQYLSQARNAIPKNEEVPESLKGTWNKAEEQIRSLQDKLEKVTQVQAENLTSLNSSEKLIKLPQYLAAQVNNNIVSYDKENGLTQDGVLKSSETIESAVALNKAAVIYNGSSLFVWDYETGKVGPSFISSVPPKEAFVNLKFYPTNSRVYTVNKQTNQIVSFVVNIDRLSRPVVAVSNSGDFSTTQDFAIDGSIYLLLEKEIVKFTAGRPAEFNMPHLSKPLSGSGKIATEINFTNIYVLDTGNNRILVLDKRGGLVTTLVSDKFTKLKDFQVDEPNKTIYVLNDSSLLKVTF